MAEQKFDAAAAVVKALDGERVTVTRVQYEAMLVAAGPEHLQVRAAERHGDIYVEDR